MEINCKNEHRNYKCILSASKGFHGISYILSRNNEPLFYEVLIRLVVTCVSETWVRAKKDEETIVLIVVFPCILISTKLFLPTNALFIKT